MTNEENNKLLREIEGRVPPIPLSDFRFCPFCGDALQEYFCCDMWKEACEKIGAVRYTIARQS
jgi:hypothetical protein